MDKTSFSEIQNVMRCSQMQIFSLDEFVVMAADNTYYVNCKNKGLLTYVSYWELFEYFSSWQLCLIFISSSNEKQLFLHFDSVWKLAVRLEHIIYQIKVLFNKAKRFREQALYSTKKVTSANLFILEI